MASESGWIADYRDEGSASKGVMNLREAGFGPLVVYMPVPSHALMEALGERQSRVGWITLAGALAGVAAGFGLSAYAGLQWNLITSAKPVLAWIPFLVVGFELAVLFGALGTFATMLLLAGLPKLGEPAGYDARFSRDRFGVFVPCSEAERDRARRALEASEAEAIRPVAGNTNGTEGGKGAPGSSGVSS
ncbi:MAG: DUF3341 domain-containing protein [Planctomycetota bacterium]|jgi:molybdopterin-containing oxidoreductase family membrane subunit